jgi:hypothetical protein
MINIKEFLTKVSLLMDTVMFTILIVKKIHSLLLNLTLIKTLCNITILEIHGLNISNGRLLS